MNKFENIKDMDQNSLIFMYTHEDIITPIIVHIKLSTPEQQNLDLNQDLINMVKNNVPKEQQVLPKIIKAFSNESALPQHYALSYQTDLYFPEQQKLMKKHTPTEILTMK